MLVTIKKELGESGTDGEEDQDISLGRGHMDLEHGGDGCMEVIGFRLSGVPNLDRETTSRNWHIKNKPVSWCSQNKVRESSEKGKCNTNL